MERSNFEIWFAVVFNASGQAFWLRRSRLGDRYFVWASLFDSRRPERHCYGAEEKNWESEEARALKGSKGEVLTAKGWLAWELTWTHRFPARTHAPKPWSDVPCLGTRGLIVSPFGRAEGWVRLKDERFEFSNSTMTLQHLWGRKRVHKLYWAFVPGFDDDPDETGIEMVAVKMNPTSPTLVFGTILQNGNLLHGHSILSALRGSSRADFPRWRAAVRIGDNRMTLEAHLNEAQLTPYIYRDLDGSPRYIAHSDSSRVEVQLARSEGVKALRSSRAAVEFHGPSPWSSSHHYLDPHGHTAD